MSLESPKLKVGSVHNNYALSVNSLMSMCTVRLVLILCFHTFTLVKRQHMLNTMKSSNMSHD